MARRRMPELPDTGRRYLENTGRARLASPGVERWRRPQGASVRIAVAMAIAAALVAAMLWLS